MPWVSDLADCSLHSPECASNIVQYDWPSVSRHWFIISIYPMYHRYIAAIYNQYITNISLIYCIVYCIALYTFKIELLCNQLAASQVVFCQGWLWWWWWWMMMLMVVVGAVAHCPARAPLLAERYRALPRSTCNKNAEKPQQRLSTHYTNYLCELTRSVFFQVKILENFQIYSCEKHARLAQPEACLSMWKYLKIFKYFT